MTNTEIGPRVSVRLASMSTTDLRRLVTYAGTFDHTAEQAARTAHTVQLAAGELKRRGV